MLVRQAMPRVFAIILLLVSVVTFAPLVLVGLQLAKGEPVGLLAWLGPLLILATAAMLTWLLHRKEVPLTLYAAAFVLWLVTAGYCLTRLLLPIG